MVFLVLCGGSGSRLWPLSRTLMPKQFLSLVGNRSLFELTLLRNHSLMGDSDVLHVMSNDNHRFLAMDQSRDVGVPVGCFLFETVSKNTAAAIIMHSILVSQSRGPDEVVIALPSDHLIEGEDAYRKNVSDARLLAQDGFIVVFGVMPSSPETGYGYISSSGEGSSREVLAFHEKPSLELAEEYLKDRSYYWNSGMFCYKSGVLLEEAQKFAPDIYGLCLKVVRSSNHSKIGCNDIIRLDRSASLSLPNKSVDYAIVEKTDRLKMVVADFTWSDLGSFDSLSRKAELSGGAGFDLCSNVESIDSSNNFIVSNKLVSTVGIDDCVVIDTADALLVAKRGHTEKVKDIVDSLSKKGSDAVHVHNVARRPWGSYTVLQEHKNYKLKSIVVKPGERLSLQRHYHRSEHWIVVSGSAIVRVSQKEVFLKANQSTYIPAGEVHRLENPGKIDLIIIEIQVGEYLGEDDIVRLEDDYQR